MYRLRWPSSQVALSLPSVKRKTAVITSAFFLNKGLHVPRNLLCVALLLAPLTVYAELSPEEQCQRQGAVAEEASRLRLSGVDQETATSQLVEQFKASDPEVPSERVGGMVMISYMAKMDPEKMRDYVIDQCKQNILQ